MQALIELIAGFVAMLVAVALSQFGLNVDLPDKPQREIRRVHDCSDQSAAAIIDVTVERRQSC
ncbi:MAG: hypothetical protein ACOH2M_29920 [Cypionkella sp.]